MSFETIEYRVEEGVGVLRFNRAETLNSCNTRIHGEVREAQYPGIRNAADLCRERSRCAVSSSGVEPTAS